VLRADVLLVVCVIDRFIDVVPASMGGVVYGYQRNETLVSYEIDHSASPRLQDWPSYSLAFGTQLNFYCPPTICPVINYLTGNIQVAVIIPWLYAPRDVVRFDTVEFLGRDLHT
jgi:hypothetical protein